MEHIQIIPIKKKRAAVQKKPKKQQFCMDILFMSSEEPYKNLWSWSTAFDLHEPFQQSFWCTRLMNTQPVLFPPKTVSAVNNWAELSSAFYLHLWLFALAPVCVMSVLHRDANGSDLKFISICHVRKDSRSVLFCLYDNEITAAQLEGKRGRCHSHVTEKNWTCCFLWVYLKAKVSQAVFPLKA